MFARFKYSYKNFYLMSFVLFLVAMLFIAETDLFTQFKLMGDVKELEREKEWYTSEIEHLKVEQEHLNKSNDALEAFAREAYLMKRPEEDIYIIVEEQQ